jgi:hypothetical protein
MLPAHLSEGFLPLLVRTQTVGPAQMIWYVYIFPTLTPPQSQFNAIIGQSRASSEMQWILQPCYSSAVIKLHTTRLGVQPLQAVTGGLRTSLSTTVYTAVSSHPVRSLAIRPDRLPVHATRTSPQVVTAHGQILHYTHSIRCRDVAKTCSNE